MLVHGFKTAFIDEDQQGRTALRPWSRRKEFDLRQEISQRTCYRLVSVLAFMPENSHMFRGHPKRSHTRLAWAARRVARLMSVHLGGTIRDCGAPISRLRDWLRSS